MKNKNLSWQEAVEQYNEKKEEVLKVDIPLSDEDIQIINCKENGEYKINSYNEKRLFLILADGNLLLHVFGNIPEETYIPNERDADEWELTKVEFCKNALSIMCLPKREHIYALAGLIQLYTNIVESSK